VPHVKRLVLTLALAAALAGCGGGGSEAADVPQGFKTLTGDGWSLAYPETWEVTTAGGSRLAQGPKGVGGLAPQAAVARQLKPPPFELSLEAFRNDQTLRRGNYKITRDAQFDLDGADDAHIIEADYIERTPGGTTPVKTIDLLVRTDDGEQLDFLLRAPQADFDRMRLNEVLDTIRVS
jgi:hypothetical protein